MAQKKCPKPNVPLSAKVTEVVNRCGKQQPAGPVKTGLAFLRPNLCMAEVGATSKPVPAGLCKPVGRGLGAARPAKSFRKFACK